MKQSPHTKQTTTSIAKRRASKAAAPAPYPRWRTVTPYILIAALLIATILISWYMLRRQSITTRNAPPQSPVVSNNDKISQALKQHQTPLIIGSKDRLQQLPSTTKTLLATACNQPVEVEDPTISNSNAFAVVATHSLKGCKYTEVAKLYGKPSSLVMIEGTWDAPHEVLMYYDNGPNDEGIDTSLFSQDTLDPTQSHLIESLHNTCKTATSAQIIAHQDDDILFMSPDLQREADKGTCLRTIYLTSGDSGAAANYWIAREQGAQAAYNALYRTKFSWQQTTIKVGDKRFITVSTPKERSDISLIFLRLPDGGQFGRGFASSRHEGLQKLRDGAIGTIHSTDGQSEYTSAQLAELVHGLLTTYEPTTVRTQASHNSSRKYPDHVDHIATALYARDVVNTYAKTQSRRPELLYYDGYGVKDQAVNVAGEDYNQKVKVFLAYADHDGAVCHTQLACERDPAYGTYLKRMYSYR